MAERAVRYFGMFGDEVSYISRQKEETSDTHNGNVDMLVKKILDESFDRVTKLLTNKDKELRNLSKELNVLFVTASQLNRGAVEEIEFDHSHIAGGISKINTADNVFGIFTSRAMRERGKYQLQLMKTRSSSGVGQKVELGFDISSLRITDLGENYQPEATPQSDVMDKLKTRSTVGPSETQEEQPKITADVQASKLQNMLKNI